MRNSKPIDQDDPNIADFQKALQFYNLVEQSFGEEMQKYQLTFPIKYKSLKDFMTQFSELDELQRLMWCEYQLKEAYTEYNTRDGQVIARKNILWTLLICREFKIQLTREYQIMKMVKALWLEKLTAKEQVKEQLRRIFLQIGQGQLLKASSVKEKQKTEKKNSQTSCGSCLGSDCSIF